MTALPALKIYTELYGTPPSAARETFVGDDLDPYLEIMERFRQPLVTRANELIAQCGLEMKPGDDFCMLEASCKINGVTFGLVVVMEGCKDAVTHGQEIFDAMMASAIDTVREHTADSPSEGRQHAVDKSE